MPENKYLDTFTSGIEESNFAMDTALKQKILLRTHKKIKNGWFYFKRIAAACLILAALSAFIPNTPVNALCQKIFSFIPGIGIVQNPENDVRISRVLGKRVKVTDGKQFIEFKTAYITDKTLNISMKTNIGAIDAGEFADPAEFKKFFAGETAPKLYLLGANGKIKSSHSVWGGPSYETRVYSVDASFYLVDNDIDDQVFRFELEGFSKTIELTMVPVSSGTSPESLGNVAVIDNVMVFANVSREGDVLEVLLSSVAPKDYKNIRFHLFDEEKRLFERGVHIIDKEGNIYEPDEGMRKLNNSDINNLYFEIPEGKEELKLVIPQILYNRVYDEDDIKIAMPKPGKDKEMNKEWNLGEGTLTIEKASIIPSNDPMLPDEFKKYDCIKIDANYKPGQNSREIALRVLPKVEVPDSWIDYTMTSQSTYAELWNVVQRGYSITAFDGMETTRKILLKFDVEFAMKGSWVIDME